MPVDVHLRPPVLARCSPFRHHRRALHNAKLTGNCWAGPAPVATTDDEYLWNGSDEFDAQGDRRDEQPLPLPQIDCMKTITLVRHGQSQWNASGRIQGSSNASLLTEKGRRQAEAACRRVRPCPVQGVCVRTRFAGTLLMTCPFNASQLEGERFDSFFCSPLQRAVVTGETVWADRPGTAQVLITAADTSSSRAPFLEIWQALMS